MVILHSYLSFPNSDVTKANHKAVQNMEYATGQILTLKSSIFRLDHWNLEIPFQDVPFIDPWHRQDRLQFISRAAPWCGSSAMIHDGHSGDIPLKSFDNKLLDRLSLLSRSIQSCIIIIKIYVRIYPSTSELWAATYYKMKDVREWGR